MVPPFPPCQLLEHGRFGRIRARAQEHRLVATGVTNAVNRAHEQVKANALRAEPHEKG